MARTDSPSRLVALARGGLVRTGLEKPLFKANLRRRFGSQPVVVFSMPKVGSTAMLHATRAAGHRAIPAHLLSAAGRGKETARTATYAPDIASSKFWRAGYGGVWRSEFIADRILKPMSAPWLIITGVRDPIAQSISAFFHAGERRADIDPEKEEAAANIDEVRTHWIDAYWRSTRTNWFDSELREISGVDVFASAFPHGDGHQTYTSEHCRVLLIRNEDISRVGPPALSAFLGTAVEQPPPSNRAADKNYGGLYERFVAEAAIPADVLDHAYESTIAQHFYTEEERGRLQERWQRRPELS